MASTTNLLQRWPSPLPWQLEPHLTFADIADEIPTNPESLKKVNLEMLAKCGIIPNDETRFEIFNKCTLGASKDGTVINSAPILTQPVEIHTPVRDLPGCTVDLLHQVPAGSLRIRNHGYFRGLWGPTVCANLPGRFGPPAFFIL